MSDLSSLNTNARTPLVSPGERPIVIWGAGSAGRTAAKGEAQVMAFVDGDPAKWNTRVNGIPVWSPADLARAEERPFVVICSMFCDQIAARLIGMGFAPNVDFSSLGSTSLAAAGVFTDIYETNGFRGDVSRSGMGSTLEATQAIRERLPALLRELDVRTLLDAPCGDFNWMPTIVEAIPRYIGIEVVPALVARNQANWESPRVGFERRDLITDSLPAADLILCRDCLVHLTFSQALAVLANFQRSGARYLLTTTYPGREYNWNIPTGAWRTLNLTRPPFSLPEPIEIINERCTEGDGGFTDKSLGLWDLRALRLPFADTHAN